MDYVIEQLGDDYEGLAGQWVAREKFSIEKSPAGRRITSYIVAGPHPTRKAVEDELAHS